MEGHHFSGFQSLNAQPGIRTVIPEYLCESFQKDPKIQGLQQALIICRLNNSQKKHFAEQFSVKHATLFPEITGEPKICRKGTAFMLTKR